MARATSASSAPRTAASQTVAPASQSSRGLALAELAQRLFRDGAEGLESHELLRLLVGSVGAARADAERAANLVAQHGLVGLSRARAPELLGIEGLRRLPAARIAAAFELGRRADRSERPERPQMRSPARVHAHVAPELAALEREVFLVLLLDSRHRLRRIERVSEGTLTSSLVHPREFFRAAVRESAAAVIAVHNHPSGDPAPSAEDLEITRRLRDAGRLLGVPLLDHVIIGGERYESLRERLGLPGAQALGASKGPTSDENGASSSADSEHAFATVSRSETNRVGMSSPSRSSQSRPSPSPSPQLQSSSSP